MSDDIDFSRDDLKAYIIPGGGLVSALATFALRLMDERDDAHLSDEVRNGKLTAERAARAKDIEALRLMHAVLSEARGHYSSLSARAHLRAPVGRIAEEKARARIKAYDEEQE